MINMLWSQINDQIYSLPVKLSDVPRDFQDWCGSVPSNLRKYYPHDPVLRFPKTSSSSSNSQTGPTLKIEDYTPDGYNIYNLQANYERFRLLLNNCYSLRDKAFSLLNSIDAFKDQISTLKLLQEYPPEDNHVPAKTEIENIEATLKHLSDSSTTSGSHLNYEEQYHQTNWLLLEKIAEATFLKNFTLKGLELVLNPNAYIEHLSFLEASSSSDEDPRPILDELFVCLQSIERLLKYAYDTSHLRLVNLSFKYSTCKTDFNSGVERITPAGYWSESSNNGVLKDPEFNFKLNKAFFGDPDKIFKVLIKGVTATPYVDDKKNDYLGLTAQFEISPPKQKTDLDGKKIPITPFTFDSMIKSLSSKQQTGHPTTFYGSNFINNIDPTESNWTLKISSFDKDLFASSDSTETVINDIVLTLHVQILYNQDA